MASITMDEIKAEWKAHVVKYPSVFRWVSMKNSEPGKVPPRRQLQWVNKSKTHETTFQIAFELENERWVLYTFQGEKQITARELVTCNIGMFPPYLVMFSELTFYSCMERFRFLDVIEGDLA